jgi:hypothetical protein
MKISYYSVLIILALMLNPGCRGKGGQSQNSDNQSEMAASTDTGFTGLKQYKSGGHIVMETNFKNGVKQGLSKTYYESGILKGTIVYDNNLRQDSSKWFFETGELFRSTPFKNDTVDGIQKQYYRNGRLKARIGYRKGLRTFEFEEFDLNGRKYAGYPELIVTNKDEYNSKGTYTLILSTSDKNARVKFYTGEFGDGLVDSLKCVRINVIGGNGVLDLKKTGTAQAGYVDVLASILSPYGNNYLVHKKVELPYKDLK